MSRKDLLYVGLGLENLQDEFVAMVEWRDSGRPVDGWRLGHALRQWRQHSELFARPQFGAHRAAYERAIAHGLAQLQRFETVEALVDHCFDDRHSRTSPPGRYDGMVPIDPPVDVVERWLEDAVTAAGGEDELIRPLVEELAFWRRSQELAAARAG